MPIAPNPDAVPSDLNREDVFLDAADQFPGQGRGPASPQAGQSPHGATETGGTLDQERPARAARYAPRVAPAVLPSQQKLESTLIGLCHRIMGQLPNRDSRLVQFLEAGACRGGAGLTRAFAEVVAARFFENVLLLDARLGGNGQDDQEGRTTDRAPVIDLTQACRDRLPVTPVLRQGGVGPGLHLGRIASQGQECGGLGDGAWLRQALRELRAHFQFVIICSHPVAERQDALLLAPWVDGVVLVTEAEKTRRQAAEAAKNAVAASGGTLLGAILCGQRHPIPAALYHRL